MRYELLDGAGLLSATRAQIGWLVAFRRSAATGLDGVGHVLIREPLHVARLERARRTHHGCARLMRLVEESLQCPFGLVELRAPP